MSIEIITATLAAGVPQLFHVNGEYFEVLDAQYSLDVSLVSRTGSPLSTLKSAEASFFTRPGHFGTVILTSANAQVVRFMYGEGDVGTRRISSTVQVVDGERARTNAGVALAASGTVSAVAGQGGRVELWNPAASGKRLVLGAMSMSAGAASSLNVCYSTVAEATDITANFVLSKLLGASIGAAQLRTGTNAAILTQSMFGAQAAVNQQIQWTPKGPIVINPGYGLVAFSGAVNVSLSANFEWFEEAI